MYLQEKITQILDEFFAVPDSDPGYNRLVAQAIMDLPDLAPLAGLPGGWPECSCAACNPPRPIRPGGWAVSMRFCVCPICGNKRCPKGTNHELDCTGSNESGQKGSSWENVKPWPDDVAFPTGEELWKVLGVEE